MRRAAASMPASKQHIHNLPVIPVNDEFVDNSAYHFGSSEYETSWAAARTVAVAIRR
jgi:hypothetical protein